MRIVMLLLALGLASPAHADEGMGRMAAGLSAVAGGIVLMVVAFDYDAPACVGSESTHRFTYDTPTHQQTDTYCVSVVGRSSSVYEAHGTTTYARPWAMWSGAAAVAGGTILLLLPKRAQRVAPSVAVTPQGWQVTKTVSWR